METLRSEKAPYTDTTYLPELPKESLKKEKTKKKEKANDSNRQ